MDTKFEATDQSPLDEPAEPIAPSIHGSDVVDRLDEVEQRLAEHSAGEKPGGLTEPDEGGTERWEAGQVWGHVAEFVPYWHEQLEIVIGGYDGTPVPFGRTRSDPARAAAIELGRNEDITDQMARTREALERLRRYVKPLTAAEWSAVGMHPVRGEMTARQILEFFELDHLEEHADQLDGLKQSC